MSHLPVFIRPAAAGDLPAILDIEKSCRTVTWSTAAFKSELEQEANVTFVAHTPEGTVCGFIFGMIAADELNINTIAVMPRFQRQGVGRRLLWAIADAAYRRSVATIHLEVRSKNIPALSLYKKIGFEIQWIRKKYYSDDGDDAIVMSRSIDFSDMEQ